jgi:sortase (surface protein transpeptidase)
VTWLSNHAGWLEGTAFLSYDGNNLLTAHLYLPSSLPGPFVELTSLAWDDKIIVPAFGQQYIYLVRTNNLILPDDPTTVRHEEYPWLTLISCKGINDDTD